MDSSPQSATARAQELQRSWYGEPLGGLFRRLIGDLGLNQARLAAVLGLSAPMLSQLMSGQRAKIGNPAVVQRLQALQDLALEVAAGNVTPTQAAERMAQIRESAGSSLLSTAHSSSSGAARVNAQESVPPARRVVREIQLLLRSLASAEEISWAADSLAADHPQLAEFLRVYGAGRTNEAVAHYEVHKD